MKPFLYFCFLFSLAVSCSSPKNDAKPVVQHQEENDSTSITEKKDNEIPPDGKYIYDMAFAEYQGKSMGEKVTVDIKGDSVIVTYNGEGKFYTAPKGKVIDQGIAIHHKSGVWIIGKAAKDAELDEIGGCSGGPTKIDFVNRIYWTC